MRNDITRDTFDPVKRFSRVLLQQGRVQLDADFNEQVSILLDYLRTLTVDLIGPAAGPRDNWGFGLFISSTDSNDVEILPGRYYVDGLMVQNDGRSSFDRTRLDAIRTANKPLLIYLDAWERDITPIEDDSIREKALGGPDTATRAKVEWAVRHIPPPAITPLDPTKQTPPKTNGDSKVDPRKQFDSWKEKQLARRPLLRADLEKEPPSDDPCACSPEPGYLGFENQLYRVEIHRSGSGRIKDGPAPANIATFKWSRDNGSVVFPWMGDDDGALQVAAPRDCARGFVAGQWVELSDESNDLDGVPGSLVQLKGVNAGSLTLDPPVSRDSFKGGNPKVRRWDQEENEDISFDDGAIAIEYDKWFRLEDGLQVSFPAPSAGDDGDVFRSGDYWLIPARVATRDIEWSLQDRVQGRAPNGVQHHYALLGLLGWDVNKFSFADLRQKFAPLPLAP